MSNRLVSLGIANVTGLYAISESASSGSTIWRYDSNSWKRHHVVTDHRICSCSVSGHVMVCATLDGSLVVFENDRLKYFVETGVEMLLSAICEDEGSFIFGGAQGVLVRLQASTQRIDVTRLSEYAIRRPARQIRCIRRYNDGLLVLGSRGLNVSIKEGAAQDLFDQATLPKGEFAFYDAICSGQDYWVAGGLDSRPFVGCIDGNTLLSITTLSSDPATTVALARGRSCAYAVCGSVFELRSKEVHKSEAVSSNVWLSHLCITENEDILVASAHGECFILNGSKLISHSTIPI